MRIIRRNIIVLAIGMMLLIAACQQPSGNTTGSEYMPDMAHSVAYEANHYNYYYNNTWSTEAEYYEMAKPREPVPGTIARGFAGDRSGAIATGMSSTNAIAHTPAGSVPFYYGNTEEERTRAMNEIIRNPYPITAEGMARGKNLYGIYCGICHGDKIDGDGYLVREDGGKYPVQPAIMNTDEFIDASNGRYYHTIVYGRNLMGAYADKLSYEERWQVIHYIRSLQAKERNLIYSETENTFNGDIPGASIVHTEMNHDDGHGHDADSDSHGEDGHGHDDDGHHESDHDEHGEHH